MAVTKKETRAELLEKWIEFDAVSTVIINLTDSCVEFPANPFAAPGEPSPWGSQVSGDIVDAIDQPMDELWPTDEDVEGPGYLAARRRSTLLAAKFLAALAANPSWCARRAAYLLESVERVEA
jgi:hypothetical protein